MVRININIHESESESVGRSLRSPLVSSRYLIIYTIYGNRNMVKGFTVTTGDKIEFNKPYLTKCKEHYVQIAAIEDIRFSFFYDDSCSNSKPRVKLDVANRNHNYVTFNCSREMFEQLRLHLPI